MRKIENRRSLLLRGIILVYAISVFLLCGFSTKLSAASTSISTSSPVVEEIVEEVDKENSSLGIVHPQMPFKLGFEFQEVNSLCGWAINNNLVQKKPIFHVTDRETNCTLWELVIDTTDIEFVTKPFAFDQKLSLQKCMQGIHLSFSTLVDMLNKEDQGVTFGQWISGIQDELQELGCECIPIMEDLIEKLMAKPSNDWLPSFNPQATIQHPLEYTIPLYFNIFGFDNPQYTMSFMASLPCLDYVETAMKIGNSAMLNKVISCYSNNKLFGLIFLHALTLVCMTPEEDDNDSTFLTETLNALTKSQQVDVKMKLPLMSRRPFSLMWQEIKKADNMPASYEICFANMMKQNGSFSSSFRVPQSLLNTNYGEQFFNSLTGKTKSLLELMPCFKEAFLDADTNRQTMEILLQQGVLTTAMIRNFKAGSEPAAAELFSDYYLRAIKSVDIPEESRIEFDGTTFNRIPWGHDVLSPPLLLARSNAMGYLKASIKIEEELYGEAIVEVRAIKGVSARFIEHTKLGKDRRGDFLTNSDGQLLVDVMALFDFLSYFDDQNILDFCAGLPYPTLKSGLRY